MNRLLIVLLGALAAVLGASAADTLPEKPLVLPLPQMASVSIEILQKQDSAATEPPAPDLAKKIEIEKTGDTRKVTVTTLDGNKSETWILGGQVFTVAPRTRQGYSCESVSSMMARHLQVDDTACLGLEWIAPEHYKGIVAYKGQACYYYEKQVEHSRESVPPGLTGGAAAATTEPVSSDLYRAWVDQKSKQPVASSVAGESYEFKFGAPPASALAPPKKYADYLEQLRRLAYRKAER